MKKTISLILDKEFIEYCGINKIDDIEKLAKQVFDRGFSLIKYGETPFGFKSDPKIIEKEIEKIVEIPVEVIKEVIVEKIIEVPVEIIKEVVIEKVGETKVVTREVPVQITKEIINTEEIDRLTKENESLKEKLNLMTKSIESFGRKGKMMKNSNMSSLYDD